MSSVDVAMPSPDVKMPFLKVWSDARPTTAYPLDAKMASAWPAKREARPKMPSLEDKAAPSVLGVKAAAAARPVCVRSVWAHNLDEEFALIRSCVDKFPIVAVDTEFPGVVFRFLKHPFHLTPAERYFALKANVDSLHMIQLGLALCNAAGELPTFGTDCSFIWEFNFRDFNIYRDFGAADSLQLLISQGIDFNKNLWEGIDSRRFGLLLKSSGLTQNGSNVCWVTFHGAYDLAYTLKAMMAGAQLPNGINQFLGLARGMFGQNLYDIKQMIKYCDGLYGGLEKVAMTLGVERAAGKKHQAGSDSLLTLQTFLKMRERFFEKDGGRNFAGVMYGLDS